MRPGWNVCPSPLILFWEILVSILEPHLDLTLWPWPGDLFPSLVPTANPSAPPSRAGQELGGGVPFPFPRPPTQSGGHCPACGDWPGMGYLSLKSVLLGAAWEVQEPPVPGIDGASLPPLFVPRKPALGLKRRLFQGLAGGLGTRGSRGSLPIDFLCVCLSVRPGFWGFLAHDPTHTKAPPLGGPLRTPLAWPRGAAPLPEPSFCPPLSGTSNSRLPRRFSSGWLSRLWCIGSQP